MLKRLALCTGGITEIDFRDKFQNFVFKNSNLLKYKLKFSSSIYVILFLMFNLSSVVFERIKLRCEFFSFFSVFSV